MPLLCVQNPFNSERELLGIQKTLAGMSSTVFYAAVTLLVAAAAAAGYGAGGRAPGEHLHAFCAHASSGCQACSRAHAACCCLVSADCAVWPLFCELLTALLAGAPSGYC